MQESWMLAHSKELECTASPRGQKPTCSGHSALTSSLHSPMSKGSSWSYLNQHKYMATSWQTPVTSSIPSCLILLGRRLESSSGNELSLKGDSGTRYHFVDGRLVPHGHVMTSSFQTDSSTVSSQTLWVNRSLTKQLEIMSLEAYSMRSRSHKLHISLWNTQINLLDSYFDETSNNLY